MANPSNLAAALQYKQRQDQLARADQQLEGLFNRAPATEPQLSTRQSLENLSMGLCSGFESQLEGSYPAASNKMVEYGIPGIKYFDGGSRGTGKGTSNFVVFPGEEKKLKILERN